MKVWISDKASEIVTCLKLENSNSKSDSSIVCLEGELPEGLTLQDLNQLGIVTYEPDNRGRPVPRVSPIEPSENLDYLRALIEAMPPGYFVSKVESPTIDKLRRQKADKFHKEIEMIQEEDESSDCD